MNGYEFLLGTEVHGRDKSLGHLLKIGVEPNNWQVTHLVVESGLLFKQAKAIPATYTESATADNIRLSLGVDDLDRFDDYEETIVSREIPTTDAPPAGQSPVSLGTATIGSAELPHVAPYAPRADVPGMRTVEEKVHLGISEEDIILDKGTLIAGEGSHEAFGRLAGITAEVDSFFLNSVIVAQGQFIETAFQLSAPLLQSLSQERIQTSLTRAQVEELLEDAKPWDDNQPHLLDRPT